MKIIEGRTLVLIKYNGKLGLVTDKHKDRWMISTSMDSFAMREEELVPIFQLPRKVEGKTIDEIIESHKRGFWKAVIAKTTSLAQELDAFKLQCKCISCSKN